MISLKMDVLQYRIMQMSKLVFLLNTSLNKNGPSTHLLMDIIFEAKKSGFDVNIISPDQRSEIGIGGFVVKNFYVQIENTNKNNFIKRLIVEFKFAHKATRIALQLNADAVFVQSTTIPKEYIKPLKKHKIKVLLNVQDIFPQNLHFSEQLPLDFLTYHFFLNEQKKALKIVDRVVTVSDDMAETLAGNGLDRQKIAVVYNWSYSDTPIGNGGVDRDEQCIIKRNDNCFNVLYAGNIGKMQNVEELLLAAELLGTDNIIFHILGDGANKNKIMKRFSNLKNVIYYPFVDQQYAEKIYSQADLNVIPLKPKGIFTAMPSKTATCFRTRRPVLFCIDENSISAKIFKELGGVYVTKPNYKTIANKITEISKKTGNQYDSRDSFFLMYMSKKSNPRKYISAIESMLNT